jgi:hypothetical protein
MFKYLIALGCEECAVIRIEQVVVFCFRRQVESHFSRAISSIVRRPRLVFEGSKPMPDKFGDQDLLVKIIEPYLLDLIMAKTPYSARREFTSDTQLGKIYVWVK